ncbi:MAG: amidophosphoribosyltransferase [Candidatus Omnitrophota bacterium]|nr:amidophosphoribosyltransferase [Candidatus Omnitrophota bacterium]
MINEYLKDKCGVFGIFGHKDAARLTYLGLYALQHRGQESAGIITSDGRLVREHKGMGLVSEVFNEEEIAKLTGNIAVGHTRYSTTGSSNIKNAQPFLVETLSGHMAVAHNGNLVNALTLRKKLEKDGAIFQSSMDSEIVIHAIAHSKKKDFKERIMDGISQLEGAFSMALLVEDGIIAVRDKRGFRPLSLGKLDGAYVIASETCAFDLIHVEFIRDIEPGEILFITEKGLKSARITEKAAKSSFCIFEYIYFSRPDSNIYGHNVHLARKRLGAELAKEAPCKADLVIAIPDSGSSAAVGYSEQSGIPLDMGMIRNHYIGRTFIQPSQQIRDLSVRVKLNPIKEVVKGKKLVVIEDSIVRGTTSKARIRTLREAGAKEIHMRVSCPQHISPCYYGIDFPTKEELIASSHTVEEIRRFIGLDSLAYLSLAGLYKAMPLPKNKFCVSCFTGKYPVLPEQGIGKFNLENQLSFLNKI